MGDAGSTPSTAGHAACRRRCSGCDRYAGNARRIPAPVIDGAPRGGTSGARSATDGSGRRGVSRPAGPGCGPCAARPTAWRGRTGRRRRSRRGSPAPGRGPRRAAPPTPRSARTGRQPRRGLDDASRQAGERGVEVGAQRRAGQRAPPVVARQAGDAGEHPVDLEPLGEREVEPRHVLGVGAGRAARSRRCRAAPNTSSSAAALAARGRAGRRAPRARRRARCSRSRSTPTQHVGHQRRQRARSSPRNRSISAATSTGRRGGLQQPARRAVEQPARLEVERALRAGRDHVVQRLDRVPERPAASNTSRATA